MPSRKVAMAEWSESALPSFINDPSICCTRLVTGSGTPSSLPVSRALCRVLLVQPDPKPRLEVTLDHHRRLGVQHGAPRKSAPYGLVDDVRIEAGLAGQHQGLGHGLDVRGDDYLVRQLRSVPGSVAAAEDHTRAQGVENVDVAVEDGLLAADHDGQCPVDGLRLSAANRGVEEGDPSGLAGGGDLL